MIGEDGFPPRQLRLVDVLIGVGRTLNPMMKAFEASGSRLIRWSRQLLVNDGHFHTFYFSLLKGKRQSFSQTYIDFNDGINGFLWLQGIKRDFQGWARLDSDVVSSVRLAFLTRCTRWFFIFINRKVVTRHWRFVPSSDRNRSGDGHRNITTSKVIGHGTDTSRYFRQRWVLNIQGTLLNRVVTLPFSTRFDNGTDGTNSWICLEFLVSATRRTVSRVHPDDILVELSWDFCKLKSATPGSYL